MNIKQEIMQILISARNEQAKFNAIVRLAKEVEGTLEAYKNRESLRLEELQRAKATHDANNKFLSLKKVIEELGKCDNARFSVSCELTMLLCFESINMASVYEKALACEQRLITY